MTQLTTTDEDSSSSKSSDFILRLFRQIRQLQKLRKGDQFTFLTNMLATTILKDLLIVIFFLLPIDTLQSVKECLINWHKMFTLEIELLMFVCLAILIIANIIDLHKVEPSFYFIKYGMPILELTVVLNTTIIVLSIRRQLQATNYGLIILNLLTLTTIFTIQLIHSTLDFNCWHYHLNYYQRRLSIPTIIINLFTLILVIIVIAIADSSGTLNTLSKIIVSFTLLILSIFKIKYQALQSYYLVEYSRYVKSLLCFAEFSTVLMISAYHLVSLPQFISKMPQTIILMTLLAFLAQQNYKIYHFNQLYLSSVAQLSNTQQAMDYIICLQQLSQKMKKDIDDVMLTSLHKKHQLTCYDVYCPCRDIITTQAFIKWHIITQLDHIVIKFRQPMLFIQVLNIKLKFKYYPQILSELRHSTLFIEQSLTISFAKYCLQQQVKQFIEDNNFEINVIDTQVLFKLQAARDKIKKIIIDDIEVRWKNWKYINKGLCRVGELENLCSTSLLNLRRVLLIHAESRIVFRKSKQLTLLLLFYYTRVALMKVRRDLLQNMKEIIDGLKQQQLRSLKQFRKYIFHRQSCVIQTLVDYHSMGGITSASRNIENLFGFPLDKCIGMSVNKLMPEFMAIQHQNILKNWSKTGTWRTIGKLKEIFCVHRQQFCFSALIYLKIYCKKDQLYFITSVFKLNDTDYLLMNPTLKIQGMGRKFYFYFGNAAKKVNLSSLMQQDASDLKTLAHGQSRTLRRTFLCLRNQNEHVEKYLQQFVARVDPNEKQIITNSFRQKLLKVCEQRYDIDFTIRRQKMGNIYLLIMQLKESHRLTMIESQMQRLDLYDHTYFSDEPDNNSDLKSAKLALQITANTSVAKTHQKQSFTVTKLIQQFLTILQFPTKIRDQRLLFTSIGIIFLLVCLSTVNIFSQFGYRQQILHLQRIMTISQSSSDNTQLAEIMYGQLYILISQGNPSPEFATTIVESIAICQYEYTIAVNAFQYLLKVNVPFSSQTVDSYMFYPANWTSKTLQIINMQIWQFLENYYYLTMNIINILKNTTTNQLTSNHDLIQRLNLVHLNFPQLQYITEKLLQDFIQQFVTIDLNLTIFFYQGILAFLFFTLLLAILVNCYFKFRFQQKLSSVKIFCFIPSNFIDCLKDYYTHVSKHILSLRKSQQMSNFDELLFSQDTVDLLDIDLHQSSSPNKTRFLNYQGYQKWLWILLIFILLNCANYVNHNQVKRIFTPLQSSIDLMMKLNRAENKLIEAYIQIKSAYEIDRFALTDAKQLNSQLFQKLHDEIYQSEVTFNNLINLLSKVFVDVDNDFLNNFVTVVATDLCDIVNSTLNKIQIEQCQYKGENGLLSGGLTIAMQFYQRYIWKAVIDLIESNYTNKHQDYFTQQQFVQFDKIIIQTFRGFQALQACTLNTVLAIIDITIKNFILCCIYIGLICFCLIIAWLLSVKYQKQMLTIIHSYCLLIPYVILRSNKRVIKFIKDNFEYTIS